MYVYILLCNDGTYYTGVTNNLDRRIKIHDSGINKDSYTFSRRPLELVYFTICNNPIHAIELEKKIKSWSQAKKKALIDERYDLLPNLAKKNFKKNVINS